MTAPLTVEFVTRADNGCGFDSVAKIGTLDGEPADFLPPSGYRILRLRTDVDIPYSTVIVEVEPVDAAEPATATERPETSMRQRAEAFDRVRAATLIDQQAKAYDRLSEQCDELASILRDLLGVVDESNGIAGWHLNGDVAPWSSFPAIGAARRALEGLGDD